MKLGEMINNTTKEIICVTSYDYLLSELERLHDDFESDSNDAMTKMLNDEYIDTDKLINFAPMYTSKKNAINYLSTAHKLANLYIEELDSFIDDSIILSKTDEEIMENEKLCRAIEGVSIVRDYYKDIINIIYTELVKIKYGDNE